MHLDSLPDETRRLLKHLSADPVIGQFTLIGGTALALSWGHRRSEDLDFAVPDLNLPREACTAILRQLEGGGWRLSDITDHDARLEAENDGLDLASSQQDWQCRYGDNPTGVKLTFFADFQPARRQEYDAATASYGDVRLMQPEGIFMLKSQVLMQRTTIRDLFDINCFLERGKTVEDVFAAVQRTNPYITYDLLRARLLPARLPAQDPGLASLIDRGPKTFEEIKISLQHHFDAADQRQAAKILEESPGPDPAAKPRRPR